MRLTRAKELDVSRNICSGGMEMGPKETPGEVDMLEKHLVLSGKEEGKKHKELAKWAGALESLAKGMANRAQ